MKYWLLTGNHDPTGPHDAERIREMASNGEIGPGALLSDIDAPGWIPLASALGLEVSSAALVCGACREPCGPGVRRVYGDAWCQACTHGLARRRRIAAVLDYGLYYLVLVGLSAGIVAIAKSSGMRYRYAEAVAWWVWLLAFPAFLLKDGFGGRSPGKAIMGLQVVQGNHGVPAGFSTSFRRNLPLLMPFTPIVMFAQLPDGRRLGDDWARTRVKFTRQPDDRQFQAPVSRDFGSATVDLPMENRANA